MQTLQTEALALQKICQGYDPLINDILVKIKEVQGVSNKTNLLAINASIETIHASDLLASFEHIVTSNLYTQAKIIAVILESDPDFLLQDGENFASECSIEEVYITDDQGLVCFTNMSNCNNACLKSNEMLRILKNPELEISLTASGNGFNNQLFKTVGISRKDKTGVIQIGTHFVRPNGQSAINGFGIVAQEAKRLADVSKDISARITKSTSAIGEETVRIRELSKAFLDSTREDIEMISTKESLGTLTISLEEIQNHFKNILHPLKELINIARQTNFLGVRAAIEAAHSTNDKQDFDDLLNKHMIIEAKLSSIFLERRPDMTCQDITDFSKYTGIGEFWITDDQGTVELTNTPGGVGFVFKNEGQTAPYMKLLSDPNSVVTAPPSRRALDDGVFKYVGVGRKGKPGIFQIGSASKLYGESTAEGFSVVAKQIKVLSEQSRIITAEIETSVEEMDLITTKALERNAFIWKFLLQDSQYLI